MFQTANESRHPVYSAFAGDGHTVWSQVELVLSRPWFFVNFTRNVEEDGTIGNIFLSLLDQLIELSELKSPSFELNEVLLVSPGWINQTSGWKMDQLDSVWRHPDTPSSLYYRLKDGREYVESFGAIRNDVNRDQMACVVSFF